MSKSAQPTANEISADHIPLDQINVADPGLFQNETWRPLFARLRREAPVHYCAESGFGPYWSITKYDDIMTVELDHEVYSSEKGITIADSTAEDKLPNFISMDPPKHTAQRKIVTPIVAPTNLRNFEDTIRERTALALDALHLGETIDWVKQISVPLTTMMLATLFDFPWEDRDKLTFWSDVTTAVLNDPDSPVDSVEERMAELHKMGVYFSELWAAKAKAEPSFDLISMMAHSSATKDMPFQEFMGNLVLLIVGGNDTTRNSMTGGVMFLHDNAGENRKLREDPSLITSMVPEIIRHQSPIVHMRRTATRDTELQGQKIAAGDKVVMWYLSGNMDETAIEEPECFIIDRKKARRHLSYGAGIHRCVGDRLADQQLRILWEEILQRKMQIEVVGEPARVYSTFIRGIRSLPVRVTAG